MANTTPEVITKDLGLVTAYGYALAGGYQGTEQQFIHDFTELMNGHYSGSQLVHYPYTTSEAEEPFVSPSGHSVVTELYTYGNISFLTITLYIRTAVTLEPNDTLYATLNTTGMSDADIAKYIPCPVVYGYRPNDTTVYRNGDYALLLGYDKTSYNYGLTPSYHGYYDGIERKWVAFFFFENQKREDVALEVSTQFRMNVMFVNKIGNLWGA